MRTLPQVHMHTICQTKSKYCFHKRNQVISSYLEIICQTSNLDKKVALHSTTILLRHENNLRKQIKATALYIIKLAEFVYHPSENEYISLSDEYIIIAKEIQPAVDDMHLR